MMLAVDIVLLSLYFSFHTQAGVMICDLKTAAAEALPSREEEASSCVREGEQHV